MRQYKKRTKTTTSKTYSDYLNKRSELQAKGIVLKDAMTKNEFENYYALLKNAKKAGEIKSQPWQYLVMKERLVTNKQAKVMAKAASDMLGRKIKVKEIYGMDYAAIADIGYYINQTKQSGLYGGDYE